MVTGPRRRRMRVPRSGWARIVQADDAGAEIVTSSGRLRATWGADVLASRAGGDHLPARGQSVIFLCWPDRRVTIEAVSPRAHLRLA